MQVIHTSSLFKDSKIASSENNDCTVATLASSFDISYDKAHAIAADLFQRKPKRGVYGAVLHSAMVDLKEKETKINSKTVTKVFHTPTKDYKCNGRIVARKTRVRSFIKDNPQGTFFITGRNHAMTIKDGVMIDNYRQGSAGMIIRRAYQIK
jgi:hypothetical protein